MDDVSEECKDFLYQMLEKDPVDRLRIGLDMASHPYFAGVYAVLFSCVYNLLILLAETGKR